MLPTPLTSHLTFSNVYPPSEDTYLLLDTLSCPAQTSFLSSRFCPIRARSPTPLVLEVGTGSGTILSSLTTHAPAIFSRPDVLTLSTDINPFASSATVSTVAINAHAQADLASGLILEPTAVDRRFGGCVTADLVSPVRSGCVDMLVCNPPYVPSETLPDVPTPEGSGLSADEALKKAEDAFTRDSRLLAMATDGGEGGMEVTSRLLQKIPEVLSPRGVAYVILCARNGVEKVLEAWRARDGWEVAVARESGRKGGFEKLTVVRFARAM